MEGFIRKITVTDTLRKDSSGLDFENLNSDVIVEFENGEEFVATFHSLKNLEQMINSHRNSKEYFNCQYYQLLDTVLVNDLTNGNLQPVIEQMILEGDFQLAFTKLSLLP